MGTKLSTIFTQPCLHVDLKFPSQTLLNKLPADWTDFVSDPLYFFMEEKMAMLTFKLYKYKFKKNHQPSEESLLAAQAGKRLLTLELQSIFIDQHEHILSIQTLVVKVQTGYIAVDNKYMPYYWFCLEFIKDHTCKTFIKLTYLDKQCVMQLAPGHPEVLECKGSAQMVQIFDYVSIVVPLFSNVVHSELKKGKVKNYNNELILCLTHSRTLVT